ncbi:c-type cytochrome biogenesis protein CcsB [Paractinoplanes brasiliensis]|uniref:Cytochrome c-type biogenesis protein CcsB n=1 Tax=Paractinoplanes brasiliensis TaxID=52695 RepID=A0A4V3C7W5_9ACTN|nr:c-type cytochrome biogenesis protein CcsB [Actinoplanes brasiliensis]TDO39258.1 cytochrome c-type biogenesis protein CcsB [Actinoplanes brasiliensis]GID30039.1 c-type cytochrome biogenesis protein CcsB [Actinoplanes brasiliensis]
MAELSNQLMAAAVLLYLAAMVAYAGEYAFGKRSRVGRAAARPAKQLVGAGAPVEPPVADDVTPAPVRRDRGELVGKVAVGLNVVAVLLHLGGLVTRGVAADRMPWGNMYEYILATTFIASAVWIGIVLARPAVRHLGLFAALALVVMLGAASMIAYTPVGPLVPALKSYWFIIHVSTIIIGTGIFLVGAVPAAMFLIRDGYDNGKRSFPYTLGKNVPEAGALERLTFRLHAFAFPLFTFGALIAGPIWAEASWGRYWGWDPKEVWAFISWIVYAGYLHARATPSVKRTVATWIALLGFVTMLMNLFGINLFFEGLHSYANAG